MPWKNEKGGFLQFDPPIPAVYLGVKVLVHAIQKDDMDHQIIVVSGKDTGQIFLVGRYNSRYVLYSGV
jgi:hypothetical protein